MRIATDVQRMLTSGRSRPIPAAGGRQLPGGSRIHSQGKNATIPMVANFGEGEQRSWVLVASPFRGTVFQRTG